MDKIYQKNKITLYNGKAENIHDLIENGEKYVIVTDPPFNVNYHYDKYKDKINPELYFSLLKSILGRYKHVLIHYPESIFEYTLYLKKAPQKVISWVYNSNTPKQHRSIAFYGFKPDMRKIGQPYKNPTDKRIQKRIAEGKQARLYDWWNINQVKNVSKEKTDHPCQMPFEVMRRIVGILPENVTVIDPFAGSGTTLLACKHFGKPCIGVEMSEKYCKIIKERLDERKDLL